MMLDESKMENILKFLKDNADETYAQFMQKLIPTIEKDKIIGVRTDKLRKFAKRNTDFSKEFLKNLPHSFFEENQIHVFYLNEIKDFDILIRETERFLPYIDNWATCDALRPKIFKSHLNRLLPRIKKWIKSEKPYTQRFAIGMLYKYFTDENFDEDKIKLVMCAKSNDYYVKMMKAWFLSEAAVKHFDSVYKYLKDETDDREIFQMTVQKIYDSRRIAKENKEKLKEYKKNII